MPSLRLLATGLVFAVVASCGTPEEYPGREEMFGSVEEDLTQCPGANTLEGIDVSSWQSTVNWDQVKASGRVFAIARVSHGLAVDAQFARNWGEMKRVGLVRGVYQYFSPDVDAAAQADIVIQKVGTLGPGDLPPVIDVENTGSGMTPTQITNAVRTWVNRVQAALGRPPIVYTGSYFWNDYVKSTEFSGLPLWLPAYSTSCPLLPSPWSKWIIHQYSSTGRVPGISGNVDLDLFNGTRGDLNALAGLPRCNAACDGTVVVGTDCARTDCAPGGRCVSDSFGVRCVNSACPATGTAKICASETKLGTCQNGNLASTANCPNASYCSVAGVATSAARCVSAFCVPTASEPPAAHDLCYVEPGKVAHCDAEGQLTVESCPAGQECRSDGTVHCEEPLCPVSGENKLVCVDANTLGKCSSGAVVDTVNCEELGGMCTAAGGRAHCASRECVESPSVTPWVHDLCLSDGRLGRCDEQGLLVSIDSCAAGTVCYVQDGFGSCLPEKDVPVEGSGGDAPPKKGCGCGGEPAGALGLGALALAIARRRRA